MRRSSQATVPQASSSKAKEPSGCSSQCNASRGCVACNMAQMRPTSTCEHTSAKVRRFLLKADGQVRDAQRKDTHMMMMVLACKEIPVSRFSEWMPAGGVREAAEAMDDVFRR